MTTDLRTINLTVQYRIRIPANVPLARISVGSDLPVPPLRVMTGFPDPDGGQGTIAHEKLDPDFLTYRHALGEGDGWDNTLVAALDVAARAEAKTLRSANAQMALELDSLRARLAEDKNLNDAVDWLINTPIDSDDMIRFNCIADGLVARKSVGDVDLDELVRRQEANDAGGEPVE